MKQDHLESIALLALDSNYKDQIEDVLLDEDTKDPTASININGIVLPGIGNEALMVKGIVPDNRTNIDTLENIKEDPGMFIFVVEVIEI